jgi:hypothetical protein
MRTFLVPAWEMTGLIKQLVLGLSKRLDLTRALADVSNDVKEQSKRTSQWRRQGTVKRKRTYEVGI